MIRRSTLAVAVLAALNMAPAAAAAPPAALQGLGLSRSDVADAIVTDRYTDRDTGITHVYLRQRHNGLDVIDGTMTVTLAPDGSVASVGDRFVRGLASKAPDSTPLRTATAARSKAISALTTDELEPGQPNPELVYVKEGDGLRLAWNVRVIEADGDHAWDTFVDAENGMLLRAHDWVSHAVAYNVFAPPLAGPDEGARSLVVDPADPLASPFGWHDTDGVAGHESTLTIGNNVHAATDNDSNDVADAGSEYDGGPGMIFDPPFDPGQPAPANRGAAVTNLFYVVNHIHDVAYHYGFTEEAGNFQTNNYGRGGLGGDAVDAHAVDGTFGTNNANFFTPPDGDPLKPRLGAWEFFEPQQPTTVRVEVLSPADIAGVKTATVGLFTAAGDVTAPIVLVDDGVPPIGDACSPMAAGSLTGLIALVDRGGCPFQSKAVRAEAAGAGGVIVVQSAGLPPVTMNIDPNSGPVGIPAAMISRADGDAIQAKAPGSVQGTLNVTIPPPPTSPSRASALDSTIVFHEYTHGISNRLTGGPANVNCLGNAPTEPSGLGEGWGDFVALVLTQKPADTAATPRVLAAYASFDPTGIRPSPLSTDMAVAPATYDMVKQSTGGPHHAGWVWSSMLWDLHWKLGGGDTALQLVFDGMKIQPCGPGFVDARNAILTADEIRNGGANVCAIWQAFARRGLGADAAQGDPFSVSDGTESFAVPAAACPAPPPPGTGPPGGGGPPVDAVADTTGPQMTLPGRRLGLDRRGRVTVQLACPAGESACAGRLTIATARRRLGSARFRIAGGESRRVTVKLSRANRRLVRRLRRVRVSLEVSVVDQAGNRATTRRAVWLRMP